MTELTAASEEVHIKLGARTVRSAAVAVQVRELPMVKRVEFDDERRELVVYFERERGRRRDRHRRTCSGCSSTNQARISGVTKGAGLEQRVMELT